MKNQNSINKLRYYLICICIFSVSSLIMNSANTIFNLGMRSSSVISNNDGNILFTLFIVLVLAPLFETLLFQSLLISILRKIPLINQSRLIIISISALLFALMHPFHPLYILHAFIGGSLLAYTYIYFDESESKGFYHTALLHMLLNLITLIVSIILVVFSSLTALN